MVKDLIYISDVDKIEHTLTVEKITVATKKTVPKFKKFDPDENQKIYIPSYVDIPKTKFKDYIKSKNLRVTTKLDEADIVALDEDVMDFVNEESRRVYSYKYDTKIFIESIDSIRPDVVEIFKDYKHPYFFVSSRVDDYFSDALPKGSREYHPIKVFNDLEKVESILSKTVVSSRDLMESMQKDETVIDLEYYKQLDNMLKSSDSDNHVVAMEIMANSNYTKSCVYLMMLIMENYNAIDVSRTKRHVNFKSLLNYLGLNPGNLHLDINKIIHFMDERELLTLETLDILRDQIILGGVYTNHFKSGNGNLFYPLEIAMDSEPIRKINNGEPYIFKQTL